MSKQQMSHPTAIQRPPESQHQQFEKVSYSHNLTYPKGSQESIRSLRDARW